MKGRWSAISIVLLLLAIPARSGDLEDLVSDARSAMLDFSVDPNTSGFRDVAQQAKAVLVIPSLRKGGHIFGGSGGSGVLLARDPQSGAWSYPAFYTMSSVTFGAQIGGEVDRRVAVDDRQARLAVAQVGGESHEGAYRVGANRTSRCACFRRALGGAEMPQWSTRPGGHAQSAGPRTT